MKNLTNSNRLFFEGLIIIILIVLMGTVNLYSALYSEGAVSSIFYKHIIFIFLGVLSALLIQIVNNSYIENISRDAFIVCVILLVMVLFFGKRVYGAKRWLGTASISFQPSELIKLVLIFYLARFYRYMPLCEGGYRLNHLVLPFAIVLAPTILIAKQPDLGTALIVFFTAFFMILLLGINRKLLVGTLALFIVLSPVTWHFLKDYQKRRVYAFLSPESDPLGSGYHTIQANIAVGTGGFSGKGFLKGVQSKLGFIPEKHTDFAFSVFAEEWGFIGVLVYFVLNLLLIHWMFKVVKNIKDRFVFLAGAGIIILFSLHFVVNLAMVSGMFPVVGVPLPLFSYGGTAFIVHFTALGFMLKLSRTY